MIKIFRNIRKNLLNEGKTSKYFKYAIGEIVLVVIGILIALQINNWNENRKSDFNQLKYLNLLKKEASNNIANIDDSMDRIKKMSEAQKTIFRLIDEQKDTLTEAHLSQILFKAITTVAHFSYENSVFTEIKNSGELKNIKNDSLRKILIAIEPYVETVQSQENVVNVLQKQILEHLDLNGDLRLILESTGYYKQLGIGKAKAMSNGNKYVLNDAYFKNKMVEYLSVTLDLNNGLYPSLKKGFIDIEDKIDKEIEVNY